MVRDGMDVKLGSLALKDVDVDMRIDYRLSRRIEQGTKGDDMLVEGRKSYEFTLRGKVPLERFLEMRKTVEGEDGPRFKSVYGDYKVVIKSLVYHSATGEYHIDLVEDTA
jgi:hypothetical protein